MTTTPTRIIFNLGDEVRVSPAIWPDHKLKVQPGDLSNFAPFGTGVYGYQNQDVSNPFTSAPSHEPSGGINYFGNDISRADFMALMRITEVQSANIINPSKDFAVFASESDQPGKDGYLMQVRVVSKFALRFMFGALTDAEYERFPKQKLTIAELLWSFIEQERKRWGTSWKDSKGLAGKFGGDGDFAREVLTFGFMVENSYHNVFRIWSRAWLITK